MLRSLLLVCLVLVCPLAQGQGEDQDSNFRQAIFFGDTRLVRQFLDGGQSPDTVDGGRSMLGWAAQGGNVEMVQILLDAGAEVDAVDSVGHTPLMRAVEVGHEAVVEQLIGAGADLDVQASNGSSAVMLAVSDGRIAILEQLIGAGANLELADEYGNTAVLSAVEYGAENIEAVIDSLARGGANLDVSNPVYTPLYYAVEQGDAGLVRTLLDAGADPNAATNSGRLPLFQAAYDNAILGMLLEAGADPGAVNEYGETALFAAIDHDNLDGVQALIDAGSDVNHPSESGQTPFARAEVQNREEAMSILAEYGATRSGEPEPEVAESSSSISSLAGVGDPELTAIPRLQHQGELSSTGADVRYYSGASVAELIDYYKDELGQRGWGVDSEQTDRDLYASSSFSRENESLTFMLSKDTSTSPPRVMVHLQPIGTADATNVPRYPGCTVVYESTAISIYATPDDVTTVGDATLELLTEAGWAGGATVKTADMQQLDLTKDGTALSVYIAVAPAQGNQTSIQYSVTKAGG